MKRHFRVDASKKTNTMSGSDEAKAYVKDKLSKVSMMLEDADEKLEYAKKLYDQNAETTDHPESDYSEGASKAIEYSRKQIDFVEDRVDDYMDDYNLTYL